ncbi:MAG TPA: hypothetical protein ENJ83_01280 [Rhodospirillales bacterium]|nr:hypothetical protein [Rhodospirillales bacterium]
MPSPSHQPSKSDPPLAVLRQVARLGLRLEAADGQLLVRPADRVPPSLAGALRARKPALLRLLEAAEARLRAAALEAGLTPQVLRRALSAEDLAELAEGRIGDEQLRAFALLTRERLEREAGRVPPRYELVWTCPRCGPVWVPETWPLEVARNCPWCANRLAGRPIPRPQGVTCASCRRFEAETGRCAIEAPREPHGHPDLPRGCAWWLPATDGRAPA